MEPITGIRKRLIAVRGELRAARRVLVRGDLRAPGVDGGLDAALRLGLTACSGGPQAGKVKAWGLSNENGVGVTLFLEAARRLGVAPPVTIQNDFSLLLGHPLRCIPGAPAGVIRASQRRSSV